MAPIFLPDIRPTILGNCPNLPPESSSTGLSPSMVPRSRGLRLLSGGSMDIPNTTFTLPCERVFGLPCSPFPRRYSGNRYCFLFLRVLRCFNSPRSRSLGRALGAIRKSRVLRLHAPRPGLSQLATSFFGYQAKPSTG